MSSYDEFHETEGAGQTRSGRASDVRGNYQQTTGGNVATQDGSNPMGSGGRETDFGSAGGQATGGTTKTYTARNKYMEYLDNVQRARQLERLGTKSNSLMGAGSISFARREDGLAYSSNAADIRLFQDRHQACDGGDGASCRLVGRGDTPTERGSPFANSPHYNDLHYFGGAGNFYQPPVREVPAPAGDGSSAPPQPAPAPEAADTPADTPNIPDEIEPPPPPPPAPPPTGGQAPAEPPNHEGAVDGSGQENAPINDGTERSQESGGGAHAGADGSRSHGSMVEIVPLPQLNTSGVNELFRRNRLQAGGLPLNLGVKDVYNFRPCET